jgi:hypothetical protein
MVGDQQRTVSMGLTHQTGTVLAVTVCLLVVCETLKPAVAAAENAAGVLASPEAFSTPTQVFEPTLPPYVLKLGSTFQSMQIRVSADESKK